MPSLSVRSRWFPFLVMSFVFAALASDGLAEDAPKRGTKPIVLVPPFENQAKQHDYILYDVPDGTSPSRPRRQYRIDRYTEAPRTLFEDALANMDGITIVERKRVDTLLVEAEFGQLSGLVDPEKATKLGKLLGANQIVIGTIIDISEETKKFKGYGVQTENKVVTAELRVRVLEIETGKQVFSKSVEGSKTYSKSTYGETKSSDRHFAAVKAAVAEIAGDDNFKVAVQGNKSATEDGLIEIEFAPKPDNCDIEIDGKYVGGSPLKRKLRTGIEYKVRISKAGHKEWTGIITPEVGLKITRELEANK
jgi:curli biogenesis system outer membrane secretion channel CsgG